MVLFIAHHLNYLVLYWVLDVLAGYHLDKKEIAMIVTEIN